jgi:hypothetical protein
MLDTYDDYNPNNPINEAFAFEKLEYTKLEEAQEYNWQLKQKDFDNQYLPNKLKQIKL